MRIRESAQRGHKAHNLEKLNMNEQKHTPGPWRVHVSNGIETGEIMGQTHGTESVCDTGLAFWSNPTRCRDAVIGYAMSARCKANARRIVACVNACEGIEKPENLRANIDELARRFKTAKAQRDELIRCTQEPSGPHCGNIVTGKMRHAAVHAMRAAIAKCKQ